MRAFTKENDGWPQRRRLAYIASKAREIGGDGSELITSMPPPGITYTYVSPSGEVTVTVKGFPQYEGPLSHHKDVWLVPGAFASPSEYTHMFFVSDIVRNFRQRIR